MACAAAIAILIGICRLWTNVQTPRWISFVELITVILYLGAIARESASCWQDGSNMALLPLVLLITAAFAVRSGAAHGARSGALLLWVVVPGICLILLAGIGELKTPMTMPFDRLNPWIAMPLFLLPFLYENAVEKGRIKLVGSTALIAFGAFVVTLWLNSERIPQNTQNAFYEYSKGVTLFGVAERFEAVSACLLTAGWFALFSFLLGSVYETAQACKNGLGRWALWVGVGAAVLVMYNLPITLPVIGVLCVISWGFLPLTAQVLVRIKKSKDREITP